MACEEHLLTGMDIDSVASILVLSDMHSAAKLKLSCIEFITENATQVMLTDSWKQMGIIRPELLMQVYADLAVNSVPRKKARIE